MPLNFIRNKAKAAYTLRGLILKAAVLGLGWLFLPFYAFLLLAVYFYFVPFFQQFKLLVPFILTIAVTASLPYEIWFAFFIGLLFFLILGIKNLVLVNRFENHQLTVFLLLFLIFLSLFSHFESWQAWTASAALLGTGFSFFFLFEELADYTRERSERKKLIVAALGALLIWQGASVIIFLPLNYFYQTAILFLSAIIMADLFLEYIAKKLDRRKILSDFSIFFAMASIILASANWGL